MATYYLINPIKLGTRQLWPGSLIDDAQEDITAIQAAGGRLIASSNQPIADAAVIAQRIRTTGGTLEQATSVMQSAAAAAFDVVGSTSIPRMISIAGAALPAAGVTVHAQAAGGAALDLSSGFTNPLPARTLGITRSDAGPNSVDYTVTYTLPDGSSTTETIAAAKNATTYGAIAAPVTRVQTSVDPVSTSDFVTGAGFSIGEAFAASPAPVLSVSGVRESTASVHAASGTIVPTTAPNGTRAFTVLVTALAHAHALS